MADRGFTLVEVLVALALLALLALLSAPGLRDYLRNCQRTATVNAIVHGIHSARRLAAVAGQAVELCPSTDGIRCSERLDWRGSLLLRHATDTDTTLRVIPLSSANSPQAIHANRTSLRFAPLMPSASTATVTVCDERGSAAAAAVIISRSGRPRVASRGASGQPLECP